MNERNKLYKYKDHQYPDALLPYARKKRWKPVGDSREQAYNADRDDGVKRLDRMEREMSRRRASLDNTKHSNVSVMIKTGRYAFKTFAKRWRDVSLGDVVLCPQRDQQTRASQHILDGHITDLQFNSLQDTNNLRDLQARHFSGASLKDTNKVKEEAKSKYRTQSKYLLYTNTLDEEINVLLNSTMVEDSILGPMERKRGGLTRSSYNTEPAKFYIRVKKKTSKKKQRKKRLNAFKTKVNSLRKNPNVKDVEEELFERKLVETMQDVFEVMAQTMNHILRCDRGTLWYLDRAGEELSSMVQRNNKDRSKIVVKCPVTEGIVGQCVSTGKCLNIPDAYHQPLFNPKIDKRTGYRTLSILCFPIFDGKTRAPIGAIQLINRFADKRSGGGGGQGGGGRTVPGLFQTR